MTALLQQAQVKLVHAKDVILHVYTSSTYYFAGSLLSAAISFVMLSYYTRVFSPAEFGEISIFLVFQNVTYIFMSMGLDSAWNRFFFDYEGNKLKSFFSSLLSAILIWGSVLVLALLLARDKLFSMMSAKTSLLVFIAVLCGAFAKVFQDFFTFYLRNSDRPKTFLYVTVAGACVNAALAVLLISGLHMGILGRFIPALLVSVVVTGLLFRHLRKIQLYTFDIEKPYLVQSMIYSAPALINVSMGWILQYVDRLFLKRYYSFIDVGIYSLGYQLAAAIMALVIEAVSLAFVAPMMRTLQKDYAAGVHKLVVFAIFQGLVLSFLALVLSLMSKPLLLLLFHKSYENAYQVMPWIFFAYVLGGIYKFPLLLLSYHKRVWEVAWISIFSAASNIALNFYLIPPYAGRGAALATFVSVLVYCLMSCLFAFKEYRGHTLEMAGARAVV